MILSTNGLYPAIYHKLEKRRADLFQDYPNAIRFNVVHLSPSIYFSFCCISFMLFNSLSGYRNVSLYSLGIMKLLLCCREVDKGNRRNVIWSRQLHVCQAIAANLTAWQSGSHAMRNNAGL